MVGDPRSRGLRVHKLLDNKTWLTSPEFLWKAKETWMHCKVDSTIEDVYSTPVSSSCIILIGGDCRTNKQTAVAWILNIKNALLDSSKKKKTTFCSLGKRFVNWWRRGKVHLLSVQIKVLGIRYHSHQRSRKKNKILSSCALWKENVWAKDGWPSQTTPDLPLFTTVHRSSPTWGRTFLSEILWSHLCV